MLRTAKVQAESTGKEVEMPKRGKNYKNAAAAIDRGTLYEVSEAMAKVVESGKAKFDETIEVHVRLGVDGRHADHQGHVFLKPH